jgi:hypothetical protein
VRLWLWLGAGVVVTLVALTTSALGASGTITTFAGNDKPSDWGDGGKATAAKPSVPERMPVDGRGNVDVVEALNFRVRKVSPSGAITTFAGTGKKGFSRDELVAGPWNQVTPWKTEPRKPAVFRSPSGNIRCSMFDWGGSDSPGVNCQSEKPPQRVRMDSGGRLKVCRGTRCIDSGCGCVEGYDWPWLAYGRMITFRPFRCLSLPTGVRCTVIQSGTGFLINRDGVSRIGP